MNWNISPLRPFNPRLAEKKFAKTVCGCYTCAVGFGSEEGKCLSLSSLGCGKYVGTCCFDFYFQCGLTKQNTYSKRSLEQIDVATNNIKGLGLGDFCNCFFCPTGTGSSSDEKSPEKLLFSPSESTTQAQSNCFDFLCDCNRGHCCCGVFEIPYCQCRYSHSP